MNVELSNKFQYVEPKSKLTQPMMVISYAGPARRFREVLDVIKIMSKPPEVTIDGR